MQFLFCFKLGKYCTFQQEFYFSANDCGYLCSLKQNMEISDKTMLPPLFNNTYLLWHVDFQSHTIRTEILILHRYQH
jgi:hypothetical protein